MSKVTMQDLAEAVGVSRITVWKALSNRAGVSDELRARIHQAAEEMGYGSAANAARAMERTVSVVVSRPESSAFWMQIIHPIAKELARHRINLMYTYMPSVYTDGYILPGSLSAENIAGFIVLNIYDEKLLRLLAAQPMPKVFLDTVPAVKPDELGGDLIIIDGRSRECEITRRILESGRHRLGFIGDVNYAQSNLERYEGFADAHRALGIDPDPTLCMTGPISLRRHYEEISAFLDSLDSLPDGFVCPSDFIAHFVNRYFAETGRAMPDGFVLTGFDNNTEYADVAESITTVEVDTSMLGKRLAWKLMFRVEHPAAPTEVCHVATNVLYRGPLADV